MRVNRVVRVGRVAFAPSLRAVPASALVLTALTFRVVFSRAVTAPDTSGYSVTVNGGDSPISAVAGTGTATLTFTLDGTAPVLTGEAVLFSYSAGVGDSTETAGGAALASITDFPVTNPL